MNPFHSVTAMLIAFIVISPAIGQEPVALNALCNFHADKLEDSVYLFNSDEQIHEYVDQMLRDRSTTDFAVRAANVSPAVATIHNGQRLLLYNQFTFAEIDGSGAERWVALTILAHQLGHHLAEHRLTRDPARRIASELEADRFAGIVLNQLGASLEEAQIAYVGINDEVIEIYPVRRERMEAVAVGWRAEYAAKASGYNSTDLPDVPMFPWLPPRPSARTTLPNDFLGDNSGVTSLSQAAKILNEALNSAGYPNMSYYSAPNGFALVAQFEQTEESGEPKVGASRWVTTIESSRVFSFSSYLSALFSAPKGRFRVIVFLVTDRPVRHDSPGESFNFDVAKDWLWVGLDRLPPSVGQQLYSRDHSSMVLIYEFENEGAGQESVLINPSALSARQHLEKAAIWTILSHTAGAP